MVFSFLYSVLLFYFLFFPYSLWNGKEAAQLCVETAPASTAAAMLRGPQFVRKKEKTACLAASGEKYK